jgi:hypothetical protein
MSVTVFEVCAAFAIAFMFLLIGLVSFSIYTSISDGRKALNACVADGIPLYECRRVLDCHEPVTVNINNRGEQ